MPLLQLLELIETLDTSLKGDLLARIALSSLIFKVLVYTPLWLSSQITLAQSLAITFRLVLC